MTAAAAPKRPHEGTITVGQMCETSRPGVTKARPAGAVAANGALLPASFQRARLRRERFFNPTPYSNSVPKLLLNRKGFSSMNPISASQERIDWVDYAKGFCIIFVVMMHSNSRRRSSRGPRGFHALPRRLRETVPNAGLFPDFRPVSRARPAADRGRNPMAKACPWSAPHSAARRRNRRMGPSACLRRRLADGAALGFAGLRRLLRQPSLALAGILALASVARRFAGGCALAGVDSNAMNALHALLGGGRRNSHATQSERDRGCRKSSSRKRY